MLSLVLAVKCLLGCNIATKLKRILVKIGNRVQSTKKPEFKPRGGQRCIVTSDGLRPLEEVVVVCHQVDEVKVSETRIGSTQT